MQFGLKGGISRPLIETVMRGHISALRETVIRECFTTQSVNLTARRIFAHFFKINGPSSNFYFTTKIFYAMIHTAENSSAYVI